MLRPLEISDDPLEFDGFRVRFHDWGSWEKHREDSLQFFVRQLPLT